ncbi:MAG: CoA-binding protein [Bacteroidales bacterium]|nr:CoA-binding protein [Bacteroidales bacterium]
MVTLDAIKEFLAQSDIAVAGVSRDPKKFGNMILKELRDKGFKVYPINPHAEKLEDETCYHSVAELPAHINALIINTPGEVTTKITEEAIKKGINYIWIQQGAEDEKAIQAAKSAKATLVHNQCILMHAAPVKSIHAVHRFFYKLFGIFPKPAKHEKPISLS